MQAQSTDAGVVVVDFRGPIQRIGAARWRVAEHEINITDNTAIVERDGPTAPGMWAHVRAIWQDGGRLTAQKIETAQILAIGSDQIEQSTSFKGRLILRVAATAPEQWSILLSDTPGQSWQVQSVLVDLDSAVVDERNGSLRPGVWVEGLAGAPTQAGAPWLVREVCVQSSSSTERSGLVTSLDSRSGLQIWQIGDQTAIVDSATSVDGAPRVGRYALVRGTMLSEDTIWAATAKTGYVLRGWLTSRSDHTSQRQWLIDVPPSAQAYDHVTGRVAVLLDDASLVHPTLANGVLNVFVEVQARATRQGWLVETVRLADFFPQ